MQSPIDILNSETLSKVEKIEALKKLRLEARDHQRAMTEGGMATAPGRPDAEVLDLQAIDKALHELGVNVESIEDGGAATL